jgi:CRISPR system Cascade subunit CasC
MSTFIQVHLLTSYPPANLNRDDMGRPKTAKMGGVDRLRVSSQSLKRAWRKSDLFESALNGHIGIRTKELGRSVYTSLIEGGIGEKDARTWARAIAGVFGKSKGEDKKDPENLIDLEIEQLAHISPEEREAVDELVGILIAEKRTPKDEELQLLRHPRTAVDIALFGRMLASAPAFNVEASCQVAHAISVHPVVIEDDYFTAVDDLNKGEVDRGAGHIGETGFAAALFYSYICINKDQLIENLGSDEGLANKALVALLETAIKVTPEGKQNSFASRAYASYVLVEKGDVQPRSLAVAFLKPIHGTSFGEEAVQALEDTCQNMDAVYEISGITRRKLNAFTGEGKLSDLIGFVRE